MQSTNLEPLIEAAQNGNREASEQLLLENSGLIWSVARRYFGRGVDADDLYQLGCVGFLKAIEGFDPAYGTMFSTYAVPKIAGEIRRFLRDDGTIKVSRTLKEQSAFIKATRQKLIAGLNREPTVLELAAETGLSPEEIAMAETATASTESIQKETGEDGFTLEDVLTEEGEEERMLERIALREAIGKLPQREQMIINLRYFHALTQERVAHILHVSQVQISRLEKRAIAKLREFMQYTI